MNEKSQSRMVIRRSLKDLCFNLIYRVNANRNFKKQTNIAGYIISIIINLLIFLSSKQIKILDKGVNYFGLEVQIVLFSIFGLTIFQFFICLVYNTEFYLAVQFKVTRFIIFPYGLIFLFNKMSEDSSNLALLMLASLLFMISVLILQILFGSQSFTDNKIYYSHLPIPSYYMLIEIIFYSIQAIQQKKLSLVFSCIMVVLSILIKTNIFLNKPLDHIQYKILSIMCFLFCVYSFIIFFASIAEDAKVTMILCLIIPIVVYYTGTQLIKKKSIPITFARIFNLDTLNFDQFITYAQYLIEEATQFTQTVHSNFCQSLIFTFYSQHEKHCHRAACKIFSQNWREQFKNISDPKIIKKLTQKVIRKLEILFEEMHKNQPQNIDCKLAFTRFYMHTLPNKIRVLELISQTENMNKTMIKQYQLYQLKVLSDQMDNIEVIDNLKIDDEVNRFQRVAYLTINSMMQFWLQFSQEKIDLVKVMNTSERLLTYKKQMQQEWEKNKNQEKYSTLKIVLLYSHYLRYVLHDQQEANYLEFFSKTLQQKLLHKKQIKYLSFGSQSALIGASLTDENLGKIVIANNQASNVFNYSKNEINKVGLNQIMPKIFAEQHDHYLLEFHKNKFKRINSDERLLFGKDKFGYIIPILLQLQRTISSMSQELLFIANIKKFKVRETPLICITDEQGQITDISSGFKEVFYEKKQLDKKKVQIPTKNVQQIIPAFFEKNQIQDCGNYKFIEKYSNQKYGQFTVQFTVIPIGFPLKAHGGFVIMGSRQIPYQSLPLNYLSITKQIDSRITKNNIEGHKVYYNPQKNRYELDSFSTTLHRRNNEKDDIYTIPFINIHDMTNIFDIAKQGKDYGEKIRIVRLVPGGALIRVETNDTFQSQDMSQTEKVNRFQFKLKQLKYQYLQNKSNLLFISLGRILIAIIFACLAIIFFAQSQLLQGQTAMRSQLLKQVKFRYEVRGYLSEYILSFQGLQSNYNDTYFQNKTYSVRDDLVNVIQGSQIEQTKKQPILKTVYLKNQADLKNLITSDTLSFKKLDSANIQDILYIWIGYMIVLTIFLVLQIVIKIFHSQKIHGVYQVFLGVDEKIIRRSYDSCLKFSQMLEQKEGQQKKKQRKADEFDQQNQNPVNRMKKYKQSSRIDLKTCFKFFVFLIVIIGTCILMYILMANEVDDFNKEISIFNSVYGLFPESSIALMNSYFKSYKMNSILISENFKEIYQNMEQTILQYQKIDSSKLNHAYFQTLMNNACKTSIDALSPHYAALCQTFEESIFVTGLTKVTNHIAGAILNIQNNIQTNKVVDDKFFGIFQLQYDFYIPMIKKISNLMHSELMNSVSSFQTKYKIWMGIITLIIGINSFYVYQFLLRQIRDEIELVKQLLYFIPDSFIEQKTAKKYKRNSSTINKIKYNRKEGN